MKSIHYFIYTLALLTCTLLSCNDDDVSPESLIEQFNSCDDNTEWDTVKVANALIGTWEWGYISCYWTPEEANDSDFEGLTINFQSDGTLEVRQNGQVTQNAQWTLVDNDGWFSIDVSPRVDLLYGEITFCGNIVAFRNSYIDDSYIDSCDNYFSRIK